MDPHTLAKLTISGFRGIVGEDMTIENVRTLVRAFYHTIKNAEINENKDSLNILIGADGRAGFEIFESAIVEEIINLGGSVTVGGILPTPAVLYLTRTLTFDAGIIITASHNPAQYNGLKFISAEGLYIGHDTIAEIKKEVGLPSFSEGSPTSKPVPRGEAIYDHTLGKTYIDHLTASFAPIENAPNTLANKIRIVVDPVNASGCILAPEFLRNMNCEVLAINDEQNGIFARPAEPNPKAVSELGRAVVGYACNVGFALDPDGDRLVVVDEQGNAINEELTLALCAKSLYAKLKKESAKKNILTSTGPFVINLSTSRSNNDVANEYGIETIYSIVGEPNVVQKMKETNSMFGGEGNGGVIFRPVNFCRDAFVGMALILKLMEDSGKTISELVAEIPQYEMVKDKIETTTKLTDKIETIKAEFIGAKYDTQDGLRLDLPDGSWLQVRQSNTEPIIRIFAEGTDATQISQNIHKIKAILG